MNKRPPKYLLTFFRWFCHPDYVEDIEGDLLERFEKNPSGWRFTLEVIRLFRRDLRRRLEGTIKLNYYGMLKHYLLISVRSFLKEKSYALTNLLGLTLSLSVSIMIWQYIESERAVDSYHLNSENKYRVNYSFYQGDVFETKSAHNTHAMGSEVAERFAGIKNMVRVRPLLSDEGLVVTNESRTKKFMEHGIYYVEDSFFEMFNYPLASGSRKDALASPNNIVLTPETAKKLFGNEEALGQTVIINGGTMTGEFTVSGVLASSGNRTHLGFDYLVPVEFMLSHFGLYQRSNGWQWQNFRTYLELEDQTNLSALSSQIDELLIDRIGHELSETNRQIKTGFQPLSGIYLDPFIDGDGGLYKGNKRSLQLFSLIALMILVVASINYVNLASARSLRKKHEVAIKRAIGAQRNQLIFQYLFESLLLNILAFGMAVLLTYLLTPIIDQMIDRELNFTLLYSAKFWVIAAGSLIGISSLIGFYPALLTIKLGSLERKAKQQNNVTKGAFFRRSLITFQLVTSLLMVAGTWLVYNQLDFMQGKELGIDMEKLFVIQGPRAVIEEGRDVMKIKQQRFKNLLENHSNILAVTVSSNVPGTGGIWFGGVRKLGDPRDKEVETEAILVGANFTSAYEFEFLAGGPFEEGMADYEAVLINEKALAALQLDQAHDALNHSVVLENLDTMKIHGVIKDVHWNSLHQPVGPTIFGVNDFPAFLTIKLNTQNLSESLTLIEGTFNELYPNDPYSSFFLDDEFNIHYESEQQFARLFGLFSIVAIIISGLGLLAMIVFTLGQKMKEIGIRKVLGATTSQLFKLLSKEYLLIFSLALGFAAPFIYWGAQQWLENYAYRIAIGLELFFIPALFVGLVTAMVISRKIMVATAMNPVEQLRDE